MSHIEALRNFSALWHEVNTNYSDPRTSELPLMETPWPSIIICTIYFIFVANGKRIMKNREAMDLRSVLIVYNFSLVLLSLYLVYEFCAGGWFTTYSFGCQPVDFSFSNKAVRMANACYIFYLSKFVELLDTVFFILRKKFNQVSFLHVFHHGVMPPSWWIGVKFAPGGFGTFHGVVNAFIHVIMYSYYGLSACGEKYQKYLWWKKYITQLQMLQFIAVMAHGSQLFFIDCNYPPIFSYFIIMYAMVFLVFFSNFFIHEYILKKNKAKKIAAAKAAAAALSAIGEVDKKSD